MPVPKLWGGLTPPPWQVCEDTGLGLLEWGWAGLEGVCREDPENTAPKVLREPCVLDPGGASLCHLALGL